MSTHAAAASAALPVEAHSATGAKKALTIGIVGIVLTAIGLLLPHNGEAVAVSWLVGVTFWTAIAIGMLLLVLIHHIFDASWSVVLRRQFEHGLSAFPWLLLLFLPLVVTAWVRPGVVWSWMDLSAPVHNGHGTIGDDVLYVKKAAFLNREMFTILSIASFGIWIWLSARLRKASFSQDADGSLQWTYSNRKTAAFGLALTAVTLTLAAIYWIKSLEYHWFSTMYGVWFFANCVRGALAIGMLMLLYLYQRGDLKGILNTNHLHSAGQLVFAFTVFWAYVTFSQYFLIWNANVPEETFWYNLREINADGTPSSWKYVGLFILFGHFLAPFLYLLSYKNKIVHCRFKRVLIWIPCVVLVDLIYNITPVLRNHDTGNPLPFLSLNLIWTLSAVVGVGGVFFWAYLKSFPKSKLIPIRDPRIGECLTHHE